jgi:hypothetical protein
MVATAPSIATSTTIKTESSQKDSKQNKKKKKAIDGSTTAVLPTIHEEEDLVAGDHDDGGDGSGNHDGGGDGSGNHDGDIINASPSVSGTDSSIKKKRGRKPKDRTAIVAVIDDHEDDHGVVVVAAAGGGSGSSSSGQMSSRDASKQQADNHPVTADLTVVTRRSVRSRTSSNLSEGDESVASQTSTGAGGSGVKNRSKGSASSSSSSSTSTPVTNIPEASTVKASAVAISNKASTDSIHQAAATTPSLMDADNQVPPRRSIRSRANSNLSEGDESVASQSSRDTVNTRRSTRNK